VKQSSIIFIFMLVSLNIYAEGFYCLPSLKQTALRFEKIDGINKLTVQNPMGYDYMPQFEGPTSLSSIPMQKMQFDDLKDLGSAFMFEWLDSRCTTDVINKTVNCDGASENKVKGIQSFYLSTTKIEEKNRQDKYKKFRYRINLDMQGSIYFVTLEFYDQNCKSF
jgi:hypothetical protein